MRKFLDILKGFFITILALALLAAVVPVSLRPPGESAHWAMCMAQLNGISKAMTLYAGDEHNSLRHLYPPDIKSLVDAGGASEKAFVCPSAESKWGETQPGVYDYVIIMRNVPIYSIDSPTLLAFDLPLNHNQGKVNMLDDSGTVMSEKLTHHALISRDFLDALELANKRLAETRKK